MNGEMCAYLVFGLYVFTLQCGISFGLELKAGTLFLENNCCSYMSLENIASAMSIAVDHLYDDGVWNENITIRFINKQTLHKVDGVGNVVDLVLNEDVDVIFGSASSMVTIPAAHLTSFWNFPHITWQGNSFELTDKDLFTTLVRTVGPVSAVSDALVTFFISNGWYKTGLLYVDTEICLYCMMGVKARFPMHNITIMQSIAFPADTILTDQVMDSYLRLLKQTSRVIFLCDFNMRSFLIRACKLGMCNGEYLFIYTYIYVLNEYEWRRYDEDDEIVKLAYRYLINTAPGEYKDETGRQRLEKFKVELIERMSQPPWNNNYAKEHNISSNSAASNLYESMYLYGIWINHSLTYDVDLRDGSQMLEFTKNKYFESIAGPCNMDNNGDRIPYFWFYQYVGDDARRQIVAVTEEKNSIITEVNGGFQWKTADGLPPKDSPACGFFGELCPEISNDNTSVVLVSWLAIMVLITGIIGTGLAIRRRRLDAELLQSSWKIKVDDIEFQHSRHLTGSRTMSEKSKSRISVAVSVDTSMGCEEEHVMTNVALYNGRSVAVRMVEKQALLTKEDLQALKTMREMAHDNLNTFLGACFATPMPCVLYHFCQKGSLYDILEDDEIKLDTNFRKSLTMDLVQGMHYIHHSKLSLHGRLKSPNCLVDNRWMLKITDFGLVRFVKQPDPDTTEENEIFKGLLWTAPELLACQEKWHKGTKEGDVYSFGIILHEIFYRMGPFAGNECITAKDIIRRVKNRETSPCRPVIFPDNHDVSPTVIKLMQMCWADNESERPTVSVIRSYVKKTIQGGDTANIVDVILHRLEKYASNLEELVDQRTHQLFLEKQKSDKLLYRMLPKSCAEKLKTGEHVMPEIYDSATVFFSDIVGFTTISSKTTPMGVVDMLNDLYSCFDDIINRYDAYKVETIGDAYLVVSGIPARNGDLHAGIIADMSLDILTAVGTFKIKHLPEEIVQVRIGNHTGSCCAGIVGLSMPRYCVFGDTVNTASRMESNGCANKIHISEANHLALQKLGGYETTFRGEIQIKGKGEMRTYWLEEKEG